ncbi:MAG: hypothetical protein QME64_11135, partial [bacterium]|nr:hypothetical protein [bacterium]
TMLRGAKQCHPPMNRGIASLTLAMTRRRSNMRITALDKPSAIEPHTDVGEFCTGCGTGLCRRQVVFNLALGYTEAYSCVTCLAKEKNQPAHELFNYLLHYIQTRPCYMIMWQKSRCDETRNAGCPYRLSCIKIK